MTLELPHKGKLTGMGIKKGITLIVGGGYHGKSTLLKALELGVYDHIAGDGREYVITDASKRQIFPCLSMIFQMERIRSASAQKMQVEVLHRRQMW